jgi:hypothetical protein
MARIIKQIDEPIAGPSSPATGGDPLHDMDPFDPAALRMTPNEGGVAVRRKLTRVPVRKPGSQQFFMVHPSEDYRLDIGVIYVEEDRETFLVNPKLREELASEMKFVRLYTWISRSNNLFLWRVPLPDIDGKRNVWNDSQHDAFAAAMHDWVKMQSNMDPGMWDVIIAEAEFPAPTWPEMPFRDLLELAFKNARIDSVDNIVIQKLRGLR